MPDDEVCDSNSYAVIETLGILNDWWSHTTTNGINSYGTGANGNEKHIAINSRLCGTELWLMEVGAVAIRQGNNDMPKVNTQTMALKPPLQKYHDGYIEDFSTSPES